MTICRHLFVVLSSVAILLSTLCSSLSASSDPEQKRVLVLNSFNPGYSWTDKMLQGINETFAKSGLNINSSVRFMDMKRIKRSDEYFQGMKQMLKAGYSGIRFDAVLACDNDALEFLRIYRDELFPGVPVVFSSINDFDKKMLDGRNDITGTSENTDYLGTIKVALALKPSTKTVVVITDSTTTGNAHRSAIEKVRNSMPQPLEIRFLSFGEMTLDDLGKSLSELKDDSVVLLAQHFIDKNGISHTLQKSTPFITLQSAVPVFVLTDSRMGFGPIGGIVVSGYHHGAAAAAMVVDILSGKSVSSIPVMLESPNKTTFDYKVLQRFRIPLSSLPPDSIIINKPFSLFETYKAELIAVVAIFILLCGILLFLLFEIMRRKKIEDSLRLTRISVETASDSLFWITPDARIVEVNEAACRSLGYSRDALLKLSVPDVDCHYNAEAWPLHFSEIKAHGSIKFESEQRAKDGRVFPVEVVANYVRNGNEEWNCAFVRDITERKEAVETLHASEAHYRSLFENSIIGVAITDSNFIFTDVNGAFCKLLGYTEEELINKKTITEVSHPDDAEISIAMVSRLIRNEIDHYSLEKRYITKSGDTLQAFIYVRGTYSQNGEYRGATASVLDISERKKAEEERKRTEEEHQNLEKQLLHAQKLESLGVLAGGIAHDFNNILMAIIGNADLALMRINKESPIAENLHRIEQAAAKAADLAKQMLAYSGKGKFVIEDIDLNLLVEEMLYMLEISISKKAVLRFNPYQSLPSVEADATQIRQIMMNLVINASEAIGDRSGVIAITTGCMDCDRSYLSNVWLDDNLTDGLYVYLEIADSGCGMDKDTMAKLFDPFFTTKFTGRGLGMAAVLGIVRGHKGAIKVYSEIGKGTTFKILLPASNRPVELFNNLAHHDDWKGSGTVLLVDDEESVRGIGVEMLKELGFTTITANDGREAVEIFKSTPDIAFVILDLTMPHMDGEQCFRELHQIKPRVKVIMSSGFNEQEVTQKFVGKGLAGFIQKPYRLSVLKEAIRGLF